MDAVARAGDVPVRVQRLPMAQDFLDHQILRIAERLGTIVKQRAVVAGVEEAVDVIDAQALDASRCEQFEHEPVRGAEDFRIFHPHAHEVVDIEEAAVVDLVRRDAPICEPVMLGGEQLVEPVDRSGVVT